MCFFTCACKGRGVRATPGLSQLREMSQHGSFKGWGHRGGEMGTEPDPELESEQGAPAQIWDLGSLYSSALRWG